MENQLTEANEVAKQANQKFEDANRKLKVFYNIKNQNINNFESSFRFNLFSSQQDFINCYIIYNEMRV